MRIPALEKELVQAGFQVRRIHAGEEPEVNKHKAEKIAKEMLELFEKLESGEVTGGFGTAGKSLLIGFVTAYALLASGSAFSKAKDLDNVVQKMGKFVDVDHKFTKLGDKGNGGGSFTLKVGPYKIIGDYFSTNMGSDCEVKLVSDKKASQDDLEKYKADATYLYKLMAVNAPQAVEK